MHLTSPSLLDGLAIDLGVCAAGRGRRRRLDLGRELELAGGPVVHLHELASDLGTDQHVVVQCKVLHLEGRGSEYV